VEGKRFGVLVAHIFEVHDASIQDDEQADRIVDYAVVRTAL
jgi:hypothetical protein